MQMHRKIFFYSNHINFHLNKINLIILSLLHTMLFLLSYKPSLLMIFKPDVKLINQHRYKLMSINYSFDLLKMFL